VVILRVSGKRTLGQLTNGTISVIPEGKVGNGSALKGVRNVTGPGQP
jgi:hypothetical protein